MNHNLLVGQSGGPTAVINGSLYGVVSEGLANPEIDNVIGMVNGIEGFLADHTIDMAPLKENGELERIRTTPGSYLGSCRYKLPEDLSDPVYPELFQKFTEKEISYFFYIGGNDSMDTVSKLSRYAATVGSDIRIIGVPKTIDNDLVLTDHTPGYGSAAKYVAYTNANKEIKVKSQSLYVYYISKDAVTDLKVGDKVVEVDGKSFQTFSSLREYINTKSSGEVLSVKVEENGKKKTKSAKLYKDAKENAIYMGVSIMLDKNYEVSPKVDIKFRNSEGGPSGGLMMSLEIYSQLINKDITRGRKIVGTGTISEDGEVGEIDGVKYKLRGAVKNKAQIFIAPSGDNYKEAVKEKKKNNYKIKIIEAKNFKQVLEELAK